MIRTLLAALAALLLPAAAHAADAAPCPPFTDLRPRLGQVKAPVRVIAAANPYAPRARIEPLYTAAYAGLTDIKLTVIEDSYHFAMFDQPEAFARALEEALGD